MFCFDILKSVNDLREHIASVALNEPYMGEKIPIRWLQFEGSLAEKAANEIHHITLTQVLYNVTFLPARTLYTFER